jgi:hypothetical protein
MAGPVLDRRRRTTRGRDPQPEPAAVCEDLGPSAVLALQRSAGNAATAALLARAPQGGGRAADGSRLLQRYRRVPLPDTNTTELLGQEKFPSTGDGTPTSFLRQGQINVVGKTSGTLLVSENNRMAMEQTSLDSRQAKEFFAEPSLVDESNPKLRATGSQFLLEQNTAKTLQVPLASGPKTLTEVVPRQVSTGATGGTTSGKRKDPVEVAKNCDQVAASIAGDVDRLPARLGSPAVAAVIPARTDFGDFKLAAFVVTYLKTAGDDAAKTRAASAASAGAIDQRRMEEIAKDYGTIRLDAARKAALALVAKELGLNEAATAEVGEVLGTTSLGVQDASKKMEDYATGAKKGVAAGEIWGTHFGAVVAKDGADMMTLQNYARDAEAHGVAKAEGEQVLGADPRWYFQMYGPAKQVQSDGSVEDQSWHTAWAGATRGFVNPLTYTIGREPTPQGLGPEAQAALADGVTLGVFDNAFADEVRARESRFLTRAEQTRLLSFAPPRPSFGRVALGKLGIMTPASVVQDRIKAAQAALLREALQTGLVQAERRKQALEDVDISSFHPSEDKESGQDNLGSVMKAAGIPDAVVRRLKLKPVQ